MKTVFAFFVFAIIFNFNVSSFNVPVVNAQSLLQYPIPELGYCRDAKECFLYCEIPENKAACWSYGTYKLGTSVLGAHTISDEEQLAMEAEAKKRGITFPIAELGNCANVLECRNYCETPANHQACLNFAKKHGFDQEPEHIDETKRQELLTRARTELGCDSMESCQQICEQNRDRCMEFARRHGVYQEVQGDNQAYKERLLGQARTELGCDSFESCSRVCKQNRDRCEQFARSHGFTGEDRRPSQYDYPPQGATQRPGGCDSEESCRKYCQEHPRECLGYQESLLSPQPTPSTGGYLGPSGCRTEAECKAYCEANPTSCPGYRSEDSTTQQNYQQPSSQSNPPPPSDYTPPSSGSPPSYSGSGDAASYCTQTPGCSWVDGSCHCAPAP